MKDDGSANSMEVFRLQANRDTPVFSSPQISDLHNAALHLQKSFNLLLSENDKLAYFVDRLNVHEMSIVIFGGWVRDRFIEMLHNSKCPSRDIDFVAHGNFSVSKLLPENALKNPFGGFGLEAGAMHVDIWNLQDTFLIRRNNLPTTFEQLPQTADYTANAVVFKPGQFFGRPQVIEHGALNSIKNKVLDFAADEVAQPKIQAARAIILSLRLGFEMSTSVRKFVKAVTSSWGARESVNAGLKSYCPPHLLPQALNLLSEIQNEGL